MSINSPLVAEKSAVNVIMLKVLGALLPAIGVYVYFFGPAILVSITLASVAALATEAAVLHLRHYPLRIYLLDGSGLVTAWLLALSIPPLVPWWLVVVGTVFAILVAKHLYGGLGNGHNIAIHDIHVPVFLVGTVMDHVAPWRSVYKFHLMSDAPTVTFVLTSGGHNAGIVSEPQNSRRTYRMLTLREEDTYIDPGRWLEEEPRFEGSWWLPWQKWLADNSSGQTIPPQMGAPKKGLRILGDAPGTYVHQI